MKDEQCDECGRKVEAVELEQCRYCSDCCCMQCIDDHEQEHEEDDDA